MSVINSASLLAASVGDYQISRSVRLRSSATAYFNRTPASAGNRKTWTWSGWHKRGKLASDANLFAAFITNTNQTDLSFSAGDDKLYFTDYQTSAKITCSTNAVFRDPSAWYHIVIVVDTTQATNSNGVKIYVNGVQQTLTFTVYTQNQDTMLNSVNTHQIGARYSSSPYYQDGYLTEVNFIDGQALTASSFGENDSITGVWKPKKYTGTYGTNGFYLNFSDNSAATAAAIGKDYSGNGNNWTPNNISVTTGVTYDSMLDVPTLYADGGNGRGNYCVLSPIDKNATIVCADGNLKATSTVNTIVIRSTMFQSSGKWYWEVTGTSVPVGIAKSAATLATYVGSDANGYGYDASGSKYNSGSGVAYGATFTGADTIGVALDLDVGTLTFYKNNVSQGIAYSGLSGEFSPAFSVNTASSPVVNFGQRPFTYTPPTGFKALNTQNLPEPTIKKGNKYFDATTYTGTGSAQSIVNAGGFQPDLIWFKSRAQAYSHVLYDSVRGTNKALVSNSTAAEDATATATQDLTSFNSNGFSLGTVYNNSPNNSLSNPVAWQWNAGNVTVSNTAGSITSSVRANPTAGISVVSYTGTGANATVGHGLGVAPSFFIIKARGAADWYVWHTTLGTSGTAYLILNNTGASGQYGSLSVWNTTAPTSSVISLGTAAGVNAATPYIAYCFAQVAGFSKFGSYTGNGSADGPFVFTGMRSRWIMIKRTDTVNDWVIFDTARDSYNYVQNILWADLSTAETAGGTTTSVDVLSNGFKARGAGASINASGGTYIFMALAENPFKNSLAR